MGCHSSPGDANSKRFYASRYCGVVQRQNIGFISRRSGFESRPRDYIILGSHATQTAITLICKCLPAVTPATAALRVIVSRVSPGQSAHTAMAKRSYQ